MTIWLLAGAALCLVELFLPTAFVAFMMGVSALLVGIIALVLPQVYLQAGLWLALSVGLIMLSRRFVPRQPRLLQDSTEAEMLTELLPGQTGRVLYEGNSWRARCEDEHQAIAAKEKVYVVRREGTTLIVLPASMVHV